MELYLNSNMDYPQPNTDLSETVAMYHAVKSQISVDRVTNEINSVIAHVNAVKKSFPVVTNFGINELNDAVDEVRVEGVQHKINNVLTNIQRKIEQLSARYRNKPWYIPDYQARREQEKWLVLPDTLKQLLVGKIQRYSDWHYPGLEIGPRSGEFTQHLVGNDPLYVAELSPEYIKDLSSKFSPEYNARLRKYPIDFDSRLSNLPKNQFGFIFSWNFFNHCPLELLTLFINEAYTILRPGGTMLFGYNNAETVNGAKHCEFGGMYYTTKNDVVSACVDVGFEIVDSFDREESWFSFNWIEIKKPGELTTIKAHQVLGRVMDIT